MISPALKALQGSHVPLHVKGQVVRPREGSLAQMALKGTVTGVFAVMASEFIRTSEFPSATLPAAMVRLFTCVDNERRRCQHLHC